VILQPAIPRRKLGFYIVKGKRGSGVRPGHVPTSGQSTNLIDKLFDEVYASTVSNSVLNI
jgi:hypothetical protein